MTGDRVLLVDDEGEFVETLAKRMKARGLDVQTAETGEAAVEKVEGREYDVVVLDLAMPGIDGIETLKRVRRLNPDIQVILLSGHGTVSKSVEAMKLGAVDFLEKPANFQDLLSRVKDASEKKMLLVEGRLQSQVDEILKNRGW